MLNKMDDFGANIKTFKSDSPNIVRQYKINNSYIC